MSFQFDAATHIYRLGGRIIPGATEILKDAGFRYQPGNMEMGTAVHQATHFYDEHTADPKTYAFPKVSDEVLGFLMGWIKFREEKGFTPARIEEPNVNTALCVAATLDREGTWNVGKNRVLVEIKKYSPPFFTGIQLALQDLTLPAVTLPRDRIAVELTADGDYKIHEYKDKNDRNLAIALVSLYWYKVNNS